MKRWWKHHRHRFFAKVASPLIRLLMSSVRVKFVNSENFEAVQSSRILAGLHANGLVACWAFRKRGYWTMVSQSRDGELQNRIYTSFGFQTVRGSSGKSGVRAALEAIKILREPNQSLIIAIDGARGPRGVVQEGAILMAKKSGAALIPVGMSSRPRWKMRSWDLFQVPKPFSIAVVHFGEPIYVPVEADESSMESIRLQLEEAVLESERAADAATGYAPEPGEKRE